MDGRFRAVDSTQLAVDGSSFDFLRIRNNEIFEGKSPQFRKIYIITSGEGDKSLIIFLPLKPSSPAQGPNNYIDLSTMHDNVKNALNSFEQEAFYKAGEKAFWIPSFKIGDKKVI